MGIVAMIIVGLVAGLLAEDWDRLAEWAWAPLVLLALTASSQLASALVNWGTTLLTSPHPLPPCPAHVRPRAAPARTPSTSADPPESPLPPR